MASRAVLPALAATVAIAGAGLVLHQHVQSELAELKAKREAEEVARLQEEQRRRSDEARAAAAALDAARRKPAAAAPPRDSAVERADAVVMTVVRRLGDALRVRERTQLPFVHLPLLGGPCPPDFAMLAASILLGTTWSHEARCLHPALLDVDQFGLSLRSLDAEAAKLIVTALRRLAVRPFPIPVGHLGRPACAACEMRADGRASYARFLAAVASCELEEDERTARLYPMTFRVEGQPAARGAWCTSCQARLDDIVPAALADDMVEQLSDLASTLGLWVAHASQFAVTPAKAPAAPGAPEHAVRGIFDPRRPLNFSEALILVANYNFVTHGFVAGATSDGANLAYKFNHGNVWPHVEFKVAQRASAGWSRIARLRRVPSLALTRAAIVSSINEITATMLLQRRAQLLLQRVTVPLLTGASLEHVAALTGDAGMVDAGFAVPLFALSDSELLTRQGDRVRRGLVQAIHTQVPTPDAPDAARAFAEEVETFVHHLLHVLRTRINMTPVNAQKRTPLQVAAPVSLSHLAMRNLLQGESTVYPHTSAALSRRLADLAEARDARNAAALEAPVRVIHAAMAALLLYVVAALAFSCLYAAGAADQLVWLATWWLPLSAQRAVAHVAALPPVRAVLVAASGVGWLSTLLYALPLLFQTEPSSFVTVASFTLVVNAVYRRLSDPLLLTHAECAALEATCAAQVRAWGLRRLTAELRRAAAAPAITLDDMLLLLDELAELTAPGSSGGLPPAASPAASARVLPKGMTTVRIGGIDVLIPASVGAVDRSRFDVVLERGELACSDEASLLVEQLLAKPVRDGSGADVSVLSPQLRATAGAGGLSQCLAATLDASCRSVAGGGGLQLLGSSDVGDDGSSPTPHSEPPPVRAHDDAGEPTHRRPRFLRHSLYRHFIERERAPASHPHRRASHSERAPPAAHGPSTHAAASAEPSKSAGQQSPPLPRRQYRTVKHALEDNGFYLLRGNKHLFYERIVVLANGSTVRQTHTVSRTPSTPFSLLTTLAFIRRANEERFEQLKLGQGGDQSHRD